MNTQDSTGVWNMRSLRFTLTMLAFVVVLPYALIYLLPKASVKPLFEEDGIIEWIGALSWFLAAGAFTIALFAARSAKNGSHVFWYLCLIAVTFVAGAEEISWGQRIFGFETPAAVAKSNLQGEMNLHNLQILMDIRKSPDGHVAKSGIARWFTFHKLGALIWWGYLVLLPMAYITVPPITRLCHYWRVPVVPLSISLIATLGYVAFALVNHVDRQRLVNPMLINDEINEYKETLISIVFMLSALYLANIEKARSRN